jgi:hypothetical protein
MTTEPAAASEDIGCTINFDMRNLIQELASSEVQENIASHSSVSSLGEPINTLTVNPNCPRPVPTKSPTNGRSPETLVPINDDKMATIMRKLLLPKSSSTMETIATSLARRAVIIESINRLAKHVPYCVLSKISIDAINVTAESENNSPSRADFGMNDSFMTQSDFKHVTTSRGALLFIDMSGFTQLSQALNVESLSKVREGETNVI